MERMDLHKPRRVKNEPQILGVRLRSHRMGIVMKQKMIVEVNEIAYFAQERGNFG